MARVMWAALCGVLAIAIPPACPAQAQVGFSCGGDEPDNSELADWLRQFYAKHAQPILGAEQRLPNGVAWRIVIDGATRLAAPRITWMPDRQAMQKANRFFDAVQGCMMMTYYGMAASWFVVSKRAAEQEEKMVPLNIPRGRFIWQPLDLVALTYATPSLVSGFQVLVEQGQMRRYPAFAGFVLDLKTEKTLQIDRCGDDQGDFTLASRFRLGDLFDLCDPASHARFVALWKSKIEAMAKTPAYRRDAFARYCEEDNVERDPPRARYADYNLTQTGLAVHSGYIDRPARECMMKKSPFNPVIIPYRELEPFMKPGPWRNELLKGARD